MKSIVTIALIIGSAACAAPAQQVPVQATPEPQPQVQPQPAPQAFDPVGIYDFTTEVQGTAVRGVLTLRRGDQGLTGSISSDVTGELPLQQVTMDGRRAELRSTTDEGALVMRVEFLEDDRITGGWELSGGLSGSVAGQRRPPR